MVQNAALPAAPPGAADPAPRAGLADPVPASVPSVGHAGFGTLMLGAIGVVYGDIGTSPLYALRETIAAAVGHGPGAGPVSRELVLGVLSLILWSLVLIVALKYVVILLRADNNGEGGTLTLVALAQRAMGRRSLPVLALGIAGAAMFYGDAAVTPAISVLSAVEGLKLVTPAFEPYVLPIALGILIALFAVQSRGTGKMAAFFGPITLSWFAVMALLGAMHIADDPGVFAALNPYYGVLFLHNHSAIAFVVLGSVCLSVTGAEALYADLGHFGRGPIRAAWSFVVFPALALNYLGQGALVLHDPKAIENPFYLLAPEWALLPLVLLATVATIIASQAVITGAFSLTSQAVQLGLLPRLHVRYTSETHQGQIYMPKVNAYLLIAVVLLVILFGSSSRLANAYGISVFGAMTVDAVLAFVVIWLGWRWNMWAALLLMLPFFLIDVAFFTANLAKLFSGGYVPLLLAIGLFTAMWTWVKGTGILIAKTRRTDVPLTELVGMLAKSPPHRVAGTAVFLTSDPTTAPTALLHNLKHNKVLHERNVVLTVRASSRPRLPDEERVTVEHLGESFWLVGMRFGYMEQPNIPKALAVLRKQGFKFDIMSTSFFLSRRSVRIGTKSDMPIWQDKLYIGLTRTASDASSYFQIPTGRVVEVGTQVTV